MNDRLELRRSHRPFYNYIPQITCYLISTHTVSSIRRTLRSDILDSADRTSPKLTSEVSHEPIYLKSILVGRTKRWITDGNEILWMSWRLSRRRTNIRCHKLLPNSFQQAWFVGWMLLDHLWLARPYNEGNLENEHTVVFVKELFSFIVDQYLGWLEIWV